jgi:chromosome segregation ATPase
MKLKAAVIILILVALGLGLGLVKLNQNLAAEQALAATRAHEIGRLSNEVVSVRTDLNEQKNVNMILETNLVGRVGEVEALSNTVSSLDTALARTRAEATAAAQKAEAEIARRDEEINKLTKDRENLEVEMNDLKGAITKLDTQIADTEKKLATSEGEKAFLLKELKRLQAEKAELERQFNDLAALREQVSKLKDQLAIARRLDWIRRGIYTTEQRKGGQILNEGFREKPVSTNNTGLNVDLKQDGSATLQSGGTNPPANPPRQ